MEQVWGGYGIYTSTRTVDTHILTLRQKKLVLIVFEQFSKLDTLLKGVLYDSKKETHIICIANTAYSDWNDRVLGGDKILIGCFT